MALFTTAEARAFKLGGSTPLSSTSTYADADITAAAARIKARFEEICGKAFESTSTTHTFDGDSSNEVLVPNVRVTSVTEATNDGTSLSSGELDALAVYPHGLIVWDGGTWTQGYRNCSITYAHGHSSVPDEIKRAALLVCVTELVHSGNSYADMTALSTTDEFGNTTRLAQPSAMWGRWYPVPEVNAILAQHFERRPGIA